MPIRTGDTVGVYEVLESIGRGGMGEVFRARDPRMGRDVAVKVSLEAFPQRFTREVHAVAALNHPNVCTLHDVGPDYLVMELVEGPTLAERLAEGPLPLDEALGIARQIADALDAAHERGIVHRDLKPGNIKLKPNGAVKVLDFGLAKMGGTSPASNDFSPTLSMMATQAGVVLGTAAYMAPEQARGKSVDSRADIWAFGVVLYEMVAGRRAFDGEDLTETLAAVVKSEPDLTRAPAQLRRLLKKCLEKDPAKRLRHIGDAWALVDAESPASPAPLAPARARAWRFLPWIAAVLLLVALAPLAWVHFREAAPRLETVEFTLEPPPDATLTDLFGGYAPSPDGRSVLFSAIRKGGAQPTLWLRTLNSSTVRELPGTSDGNFPTWSPESASIAFYADGKLRRLDLRSNSTIALADVPGGDAVTPTGSWNTDGVILFGSSKGLWRVSASGGGASLLTTVAPGESGHGFPQFLPGGRRFIYFVASRDAAVQGIYASSLDKPSQRQQVMRSDSKAVYVPPKADRPPYLLWVQDQTLLAQRFDVKALRRDGEPIAVAEGIGLNPAIAIRAAFWASDAGLLTFFASPGGVRRTIAMFTEDGRPLGDALPSDSLGTPALSPDGTQLAIARTTQGAGGTANVWVWDFRRKASTKLTFHKGQDSTPVWSPDSKRIAFSSTEQDGVTQIFVKDASGSGTEERLTEGSMPRQPLDWVGGYLLYRERGSGTDWDLFAMPLEGDRRPIPLVHTQYVEDNGRLSPDGLWLAYRSNDTGQPELYIEAFPPGSPGRPGGRVKISSGGASDMKWRKDSRRLYYESPDGRIMAVDLRPSPAGMVAEMPQPLFSAGSDVPSLHSFEATPDGKQFYVLQSPRIGDNATKLTIISNWQPAHGR
jgi:Tol biopolymer transport system component/tRNA A-37 threonylcarbamoyl transferase component Bud32